MPLRRGTPIPSLAGATEWINSEITDAQIKSPCLVYFWAVSCHICHENMPKLTKWREQYGNSIQFVSVHFPRQPEDTDVDKVKAQAIEFGITDPLAVDNKHKIADAFDNQYVPAYFLFGPDGTLISRSAGDAGLTMVEAAIERMLKQG